MGINIYILDVSSLFWVLGLIAPPFLHRKLSLCQTTSRSKAGRVWVFSAGSGSVFGSGRVRDGYKGGTPLDLESERQLVSPSESDSQARGPGGVSGPGSTFSKKRHFFTKILMPTATSTGFLTHKKSRIQKQTEINGHFTASSLTHRHSIKFKQHPHHDNDHSIV